MTHPARRDPFSRADFPMASRQYRMSGLISAISATALMWVTGTAQAATTCVRNIPPSNPNSVYWVHDNGTVTDSRTHLMWKRCMEGEAGSACNSGVFPSMLNWAPAMANAKSNTFAGYHDWRMPNIKELFTLVELCASNPDINTDIFPNVIVQLSTAVSAKFYSSSPLDKNLTQGANVWEVDFQTGFVTLSGSTTSGDFVRLVRDDHDTIFAGDFDF